jgi:hypothetical protein
MARQPKGVGLPAQGHVAADVPPVTVRTAEWSYAGVLALRHARRNFHRELMLMRLKSDFAKTRQLRPAPALAFYALGVMRHGPTPV